MWLVAAVVIAAGVGGWWYAGNKGQYANPGSTTSQNQANAPAKTPNFTLTVTGSEYSFTPSSFTVNKGDRVALTFKNAGTTSHTFTIAELNVDTGFVSPGSSQTVEFDVPTAGVFTYYCAVDGHEGLGMKGTMTVK